jgi:hypothetical protein
MYPVTELFQQKIKENTRTFKLSVQIQHSTGVLELTDKDIVGGSIVFSESSQTGDNFTIGGIVASTFEFELLRKPEYSSIEFEGATVIPQVGLLISASVDTENYFINAPQPSELEDSQIQEQWEYVPLGRFNIDEINKSRNSIRIKAIDNMIELDKPYSLSQLSYPATLYQIYQNICTVADVLPATTSFVNQAYLVQNKPEGDLTLRDVLGYVAELSGSFARMNRTGALELTWYTATGLTLTGANRFDFKPREDLIQIKGIMASVDDVIYLAGTDDYAVDLSDNMLLQGDYATVLGNIYNKVKDTVFTPFESRWQGNPAIQAGDIITQVDRDGVSHTTLVTHSTYKYRGASTLSAKGLPIKAKGYKGSTNKKISNIVRKEIKPIGDKLTSLEQAQINVTELIANMLGGYTFQEADAFYIADNPVLADAQKVWKWGIGGFGYSSTGVNGPYITAISADGTIVAMLVAANIITANMVKTGILSSEDDSTWINLNDGTFNFKNFLKYDGSVFTLNDPTVIKSNISYKGTTIDTVSGIRVNFADGGHAQMGDGSILVQHADGSHTVIDGRGIMRLFSIPIFEDVPTATDIIDNFETGLLADTRVDLTNSEAENNEVRSPADYITITSAEKYAGTYGLQVRTPNVGLIITGYNSSTHLYTGYFYTAINCVFLNYMPTKDTTLTLKYKVSGVPNHFSGKVIVQDVDYSSEPIQEFSLTSTSWVSISASLTAHHTYRMRVVMSASDNFSDPDIDTDAIMYVYLDDIVWELDVNESVITGYEEGTKPYNDFTYIKKDEILTGTTQKQIVLPDYFRGLNFDVLVTQLENYATPTLLSINNKVPSFTVSGENTKFMYTIILNS